MYPKNKNKKGFTVIELLIVVAIISILSSIIIGSLNSARTKASIASGKKFAASLDHAYSTDAAGLWDFNETSGTTVSDKSSNENNGTISGTSNWVSGVNGNAISLDLNSSVDLGHSDLYNSSDFTISFWVKPGGFDGTPAQWGNILMRGGVYNTNGFRFGARNDGKLVFWSTESGGSLNFTSTKAISTDRFYHIALTYSSGKATMYIDGQDVGSANGLHIPISTLVLNDNVGYSHGNIMIYDDVRFFRSSLLSY